MKQISTIIASAGGAGYIKPGPGTWGTLVASLSILALWQIGGDVDSNLLIAATVISTLVGTWAIYQLPATWEHDDQRIVIDEVAGLYVTMLLVPITWMTIILGFVLFRVFDIWKPLGVRSFDTMESRVSVMLDDLLAGVYACLTLHLILYLLNTYG